VSAAVARTGCPSSCAAVAIAAPGSGSSVDRIVSIYLP
jgi:hypothetical protein